ncbi:sensor histidine kinase [Denitrobaculum tricleocarpae]|uniref:histidine kinase n=1 Tax=Denitrobaculum tricleocarpae TaxID=2591009 RepID=A0A545U2V2_9PROT|nr:ATP-binding protein [Denitrobaculum tricleocarpae]TQV83778.1 hypothetical protein FKG95_04135 [Denitrobaculum tricleocarpae]
MPEQEKMPEEEKMLEASSRKTVSIRDILYRRLNIYLAAGWVIATLLTGLAGTQYFNEGLRGRVIHLVNIIMAFETAREQDAGSVGRIDNFLSDQMDDIGVNDYFIVVILDNAVRYSTIDLPSEQLLALPLHGEMSYPSSFLGYEWSVPFIDWRLYGVEDPDQRVRVIVGLWKGEVFFGILTITLFVFAVGLIVGAVSLLLARRVVAQVVHPLEDSATAVLQRKENEMTPIRLNTRLRELTQIEDALNDLIARLDATVRRERHFIANAAHELRTPLAAVRAQAEAVDRQAVTPQIRGQIDGMLDATDRASRLIAQLLQLARSEAVASDASDAEPIDLVAIARDLIAQFTPEILESRGDIELFAPDAVTLPGNRELVYALLRNLLENAVKYAGTPKHIVVTVAGGQNPDPSICIEDNGPGMSEANFQKAFAKFERLGRKSGDGAGLGLSIVHDIAKRQKLRLMRDQSPQLGGLKVTVSFTRSPSA